MHYGPKMFSWHPIRHSLKYPYCFFATTISDVFNDFDIFYFANFRDDK